MRTFDLTPLFRTSVGFDRMSRQLNSAIQLESTTKGYPPYNIAKTGETNYRITLAVAGFAESDLNLETHEGRLKVTGETAADDDTIEYLHRGIAGRRFERTFQLADHISCVHRLAILPALCVCRWNYACQCCWLCACVHTGSVCGCRCNVVVLVFPIV